MNDVNWLAEAVRLTVALIVALVVAKVAVSRTKEERLWQAKYDAYQRVLAAIEDVRFWAEDRTARAAFLPHSGLGDVGSRYEEAQRALSGFIHTGELLISARSRELLEALITTISRAQFAFENEARHDHEYDEHLGWHAEQIGRSVDALLPQVMAAARADLGVARGTSIRDRLLHAGNSPSIAADESVES